MADPRDVELRNAALEHVRELQRRYDDLVPKRAPADGFRFRGQRVSFGSFYSGIFRPKELVELQAGLPIADTTPAGLVSGEDMRRYATREVIVRLHQHRFRTAVLRAYRTRCAVCRLREATLLQAAHIIDDRSPGGLATVVNGISLCAIHHLAYDRNLLGIDPGASSTSPDGS